ncbi:MAG: hypothetical protein Q8M76_06360 [Spirochaetaceae bacterium]|nr:hypothetical protein [Spirochaetaceae bacterium]
MVYDYFQWKTIAPSLWLSYALSLVSLASICGVIAFVPRFFGTFVEHRGKRAARSAFAVAAVALLPLQLFLPFPSKHPVILFFSGFGSIGDIVAFILALSYGMAAGFATLRKGCEAGSGDRRWISLLAIMKYGSLVLTRTLWGREAPQVLSARRGSRGRYRGLVGRGPHPSGNSQEATCDLPPARRARRRGNRPLEVRLLRSQSASPRPGESPATGRPDRGRCGSRKIGARKMIVTGDRDFQRFHGLRVMFNSKKRSGGKELLNGVATRAWFDIAAVAFLCL